MFNGISSLSIHSYWSDLLGCKEPDFAVLFVFFWCRREQRNVWYLLRTESFHCNTLTIHSLWLRRSLGFSKTNNLLIKFVTYYIHLAFLIAEKMTINLESLCKFIESHASICICHRIVMNVTICDGEHTFVMINSMKNTLVGIERRFKYRTTVSANSFIVWVAMIDYCSRLLS